MMPNADLAAILEFRGLSIRAGVSLNGRNAEVSGGKPCYLVLPNFSVILGDVPFFL